MEPQREQKHDREQRREVHGEEQRTRPEAAHDTLPALAIKCVHGTPWSVRHQPMQPKSDDDDTHLDLARLERVRAILDLEELGHGVR